MARDQHTQSDVHAASLQDPERFWQHQADQVHWHKKPDQILRVTKNRRENGTEIRKSWRWFPGGEISTSYNCIDRHIVAGNGTNTAIVWDSPLSGRKETFTYDAVKLEVETLAGLLREEGVGKGDVVLIYMPMIPAAMFAMLAANRIGAIHAVVFGGFSSMALAQRIDGCKPRMILTASCGIEGSKGPIPYQPLVRKALSISSHRVGRILIYQRKEAPWEALSAKQGEGDWQQMVNSAKRRNVKAAAVAVGSNDGVYIIYTSGTTGLPKGVIREAAGHVVGLNFTVRYIFGIVGPGDVIFTASDLGWVVGQNYCAYAPLLAGATTVLFEGKPVLGHDTSIFWRIVEEYRVNVMFTAPTALRAIRKEDSQNTALKEVGSRGGLQCLRALFLAGERSEANLVNMYQRLLESYGARGSRVIDNWWSSESGSPITALAELPHSGQEFGSTARRNLLAIKAGSAGLPMPGFDVQIVDDSGRKVKRGTMGNIVLGIPLAPTAFTTLWQDEQRFWKGYLQRFGGQWLDTGDAGMIDDDGYVHVMSRADDVINVAAHRFSTGAIEQAITAHPEIAECAVVGIPDALKGHLPFAFVTLSTQPHPEGALPTKDLVKSVDGLVREHIGAVAALGGIIQGERMIPRTRSGKTLRRVLRSLLEQAADGIFDGDVDVPSTIEDVDVINVARARLKEYFATERTRIRRHAKL